MHNPNINLIKMNKPVMKSIIRGDKPEIKSNLLNESKEELSYESSVIIGIKSLAKESLKDLKRSGIKYLDILIKGTKKKETIIK